MYLYDDRKSQWNTSVIRKVRQIITEAGYGMLKLTL